MAPAKADVGREADGRFDERDVVDEETHHALAFAIRGLRMAPEPRKVGDDLQERGAFLVRDGTVGLALLLVHVLGRGHRTQGLVPLRFEFRGHETMIRIDPEIAAACEFRLGTGPARCVGAASDRPPPGAPAAPPGSRASAPR